MIVDCGSEPDIFPSNLVRCGEIPLCEYTHCYKHYSCLLAASTSYVYYGCQAATDKKPYYCVCQEIFNKIQFRKLLKNPFDLLEKMNSTNITSIHNGTSSINLSTNNLLLNNNDTDIINETNQTIETTTIGDINGFLESTTFNNIASIIDENILHNAERVSSTDEMTTTQATKNGLNGGAIAGIVIAVIAVIFIILILLFFGHRYLSQKRKTHGEYRPQMEENIHAKDLPYLPPPSVEGLI